MEIRYEGTYINRTWQNNKFINYVIFNQIKARTMKYRIKIITYANGRKAYFAQVRRRFRWDGIMIDGDTGFAMDFERDSREKALACIDNHYVGNQRKQLIEFEYINKP